MPIETQTFEEEGWSDVQQPRKYEYSLGRNPHGTDFEEHDIFDRYGKRASDVFLRERQLFATGLQAPADVAIDGVPCQAH